MTIISEEAKARGAARRAETYAGFAAQTAAMAPEFRAMLEGSGLTVAEAAQRLQWSDSRVRRALNGRGMIWNIEDVFRVGIEFGIGWRPAWDAAWRAYESTKAQS